MICVKCGRQATENINGLCAHCYSTVKQLFSPPGKLDLEQCSHCGSYKKGKEWKQGNDIPRIILRDHVTMNPHISDPHIAIDMKQNPWVIKCHGEIHGTGVTEEYSIPVQIHPTSCPRCSMILGGYYEAIIQIRGTNRGITPGEKNLITGIITKKITHSTDPKAFISKIDESPQCIDYYLGEQHIADSLARVLKQRFHGTTKKSVSLMGVKDGQRIYRVTHLIRLPPYHPGDVVIFHKNLYQVLDLKTQVILRNLRSGETRSFPPQDLTSVEVVHPDIKNAIILSETKKEIQVMDPDTYKTRDITKPRDYTGARTGQEIPIIKWDNQIYLFPKDSYG